MIDDFDEYRDLTDYTSGVFVDSVPISNTKKTEFSSTEFDNGKNEEEIKSRAHRLKTNRLRHHPKLQKFYEQVFLQ